MHMPTKGENKWLKQLCLFYDIHMVKFVRIKTEYASDFHSIIFFLLKPHYITQKSPEVISQPITAYESPTAC